MKIIHTADIHLDSKLSTHLKGENKKKRLAEILDSFKRMVEYAHNNNVSVIIIAGDFFDKQTVSAKTKKFVFEIIKEYENISFLYLCGNHDENKNVLEGIDLPNNLKTFTNEITTFNFSDVDISGIELNEFNYKTFYNYINLNQQKPNIFVLHGQIGSSIVGGNYQSISLNQLKNKGINYLALGDYHDYRTGEIDSKGIYAYSGCLEGRGFDETGPKGFIELEITNGRITHKFVPFAQRLVEIVEVDVTNAKTHLEVSQLVKTALNKIDKSSLVKVQLVGDVLLENKPDMVQLNQEFENYVFFVKFEDKTKLKIIIEDWIGDKSLKGEFVTLVNSSNLDEQLKQEIIYKGIKALDGEEF